MERPRGERGVRRPPPVGRGRWSFRVLFARMIRRGGAAVLVLAAFSCTSLPAARAPEPGGDLAAVPGFDTRDHPGRDALEAWRRESPYRWVGFYLPAPCYTGTTWQGRRAELEGMGWGMAVLFVGEQDWAEIPGPAQTPAPPGSRCTQGNVSAERGASDALAAASAVAGEGFAPGTVVYLNVERVERVSPRLREYVRAWANGVLEDGRYEPGLYAHAENWQALHQEMADAFAAHAAGEGPRLWIASAQGFGLTRSPADSPAPFATAWQGAFDVTESWGGYALRIDRSVAITDSPSR